MSSKKMVSTTTVKRRARDIEKLAQDIIENPDDWMTVRRRLFGIGVHARAINAQFTDGILSVDEVTALIDRAVELALPTKQAGNRAQLREVLAELRLTWGNVLRAGFDRK